MWLTCKLKPGFKTISYFRKDNIDCMKCVFTAFNKRKSMVEHPSGTMKRVMNAGYTLLNGKRKD